MISVNTEYFRDSARFYQKHKRYDDGIFDSYQYHEYWDRERYRCLNGYEVSGMKITGYHYNYLNYTPIELVRTSTDILYGEVFKNKKKADRLTDFPDFWDVDWMFFNEFELAEYAGEHFWWLKPRGVGAEQPHSEILISPDGKGEITMGDVKVGTRLFDHTGNITIVTEVLPQGQSEVWEVELLDGRKVTCGENHLWKVVTRIRNGKTEYKILKTKDILDSGLVYNHSTGQKTYKYKIPKLEPVQFDKKELPIPPYIVGALLGDGTINGKNIKIASDDTDLLEYIDKLLNETWIDSYDLIQDMSNNNWLIKIKDKFQYVDEDKYKNSKYGINPLKREIENLNIDVKCEEKFIPTIYKYSSVEQRLELVKGLMDTDGSVTSQGYCEFTNKSKKLIDDLAYVLRSLGIYCSIGIDDRKGLQSITDHNNRTITFERELVYRLYIATNQNIFYISRKASRVNTTKFTKTEVPIINIVRTGRFEEQSCIIVDNSEHLYLTRDFIITHNSWKAASMFNRNYNMIPGSKGYMLAWSTEALLGDGTFSKWLSMRNHTNAPHPDEDRYLTAFGRPSDFKKDQNDMWYIASTDDGHGNPIGYMSEVMGISMKDNVDKARGKRGKLILLEEVGANPEAEKIHNICRSSVEQQNDVFGTILGLGTGGTVSAKFGAMERVIYNPEAYNIRCFDNIYDDGLRGTKCGFFTPAYRTITFKDANGNSDEKRGKSHYDVERDKASKSSDANALIQEKSEHPYTLQEAILRNTYSPLPANEAIEWHTKVLATGLHNLGICGELNYGGNNGKLQFLPNNNLKPVDKFPHNIKEDLTGCVVQYFSPYRRNGSVPDNLYIIAHDPYAFDQTTDSDSIGAAYVYMQPNNLVPPGDRIVATYFGRPKTLDEYNRILFMLSEYYNAKIGFENDRGDVIGYAKRFKKLDCLADEFELAFDADISKSKVRRGFGMHIGSGKENNRMHKGNKYLNDWLIGGRGIDENGVQRLNLHTIYCPATLKEISLYRLEGGNFDRISALRILAYYQKELVYKDQKPDTGNSDIGGDDFWHRRHFN